MRGAGILGTYNNGGYYTFAQGSSVGSEVLDQCDIGDPATVVLNDLIDETTVFPKTASVASPVTIRAAMHGEAGDLAALAIVAVGARSASDSIRWSVRRWISGTGHSAGPVRGGWETRRTTITSPTGVTGGCIAPTTS